MAVQDNEKRFRVPPKPMVNPQPVTAPGDLANTVPQQPDTGGESEAMTLLREMQQGIPMTPPPEPEEASEDPAPSASPEQLQALAKEVLSETLDTSSDPVPDSSGMVTIRKFSAQQNAWIKVQVSAEEARSLRVQMIAEAADKVNADILAVRGYDPDMQLYWGSTKADHPGNIELARKGYAPVRDFPNAPYQKRLVPGYGECYVMGDAVLFECPREIAERRRAAEIRQAERIREERIRGSMNDVDAAARDQGAFLDMERSGLKSSYGSIDESEFVESRQGVFSEMEADGDFATSAAVQAAETLSNRGRRTFGGFRSDMAPTIPESPYFRGRA